MLFCCRYHPSNNNTKLLEWLWDTRPVYWRNEYSCLRILVNPIQATKLNSVCKFKFNFIYVVDSIVLKILYYGLTLLYLLKYPHRVYPMEFFTTSLWESCEKMAVSILSKLNYQNSCHENFKDLGKIALPSIYVYVYTFMKVLCLELPNVNYFIIKIFTTINHTRKSDDFRKNILDQKYLMKHRNMMDIKSIQP